MVFMLRQHFCMARTFELPTGKLHIPSCYISHHQLIEQVFLYHCWLKQSSLLPIRFRKWHYWLGGGNKHLTIMYHPNKGHNKTSFELLRHCSFPIPLSINTIKEGERKAFTLCLNHRDISFRHVSSNVWLKVSFDFLQAINMLHVCNWAKKKGKDVSLSWMDRPKEKIPLDQLSSTVLSLGKKHCSLTMKSSWLQHVMHLYACLYLNTFSRVVVVLQYEKQPYSLQKWWIIVITANYSIKQMNGLKPATSGSVFPSLSLSDP